MGPYSGPRTSKLVDFKLLVQKLFPLLQTAEKTVPAEIKDGEQMRARRGKLRHSLPAAPPGSVKPRQVVCGMRMEWDDCTKHES